MEAYERGLDEKMAIWASKKYKGHCIPPREEVSEDYKEANNI
jgi:hypothetical protein